MLFASNGFFMPTSSSAYFGGMNDRPIVVIRNPVSGRGAGTRLWPKVEALMREEWVGLELRFVETQHSGDATLLAQEAVAAGAYAVIACGGDGTLGQVAAGLIGSDVLFGFVPLGTGNDFSRSLGISSDWDKAVKVIGLGRKRRIDVIKWTCESGSGYCLNIAGCGFDAAVADRINRGFGWAKGTSAYIAAVLSTLAVYKPIELTLTTAEGARSLDAMLCAVANAQSYGGGMRVAPNAEIDDGLLDIVVVKGLSRTAFLRAFPSVFKGGHLNHPKVESFRTEWIEIGSKAPTAFLVDGELVGTTPVKFEIVMGALEMFAE